jgi:hypothetical protein
MSEPALRRLERGLPRLDMRSPALKAKQAVRTRLASPAVSPQDTRSSSEEYAVALLAEARLEAARIVAAGREAGEREIAAARAESQAIIAAAHAEARIVLANARGVDYPGQSKTPVREIIAEVAQRHRISAAEITGVSRRCALVAARHEAIAETYVRRPDLSSVQIGRLFGRDHTTILHVIRKAGVWRGGEQ